MREPATIASHLMRGASDTKLLREAARLSLSARRDRDRVRVEIEVTNHNTGHHLPTDSPLRHVMLVVEATAGEGRSLPLAEGPALPAWTGDQGGRPGRVYAKVLEDLWTQLSPTAAYWNPIRVVSDTRLPAFGTDRSAYAFEARERGTVIVGARLIYRRAYQTLSSWKGRSDPDILMAEIRTRVEAPARDPPLLAGR